MNMMTKRAKNFITNFLNIGKRWTFLACKPSAFIVQRVQLEKEFTTRYFGSIPQKSASIMHERLNATSNVKPHSGFHISDSQLVFCTVWERRQRCGIKLLESLYHVSILSVSGPMLMITPPNPLFILSLETPGFVAATRINQRELVTGWCEVLTAIIFQYTDCQCVILGGNVFVLTGSWIVKLEYGFRIAIAWSEIDNGWFGWFHRFWLIHQHRICVLTLLDWEAMAEKKTTQQSLWEMGELRRLIWGVHTIKRK